MIGILGFILFWMVVISMMSYSSFKDKRHIQALLTHTDWRQGVEGVKLARRRMQDQYHRRFTRILLTALERDSDWHVQEAALLALDKILYPDDALKQLYWCSSVKQRFLGSVRRALTHEHHELRATAALIIANKTDLFEAVPLLLDVLQEGPQEKRQHASTQLKDVCRSVKTVIFSRTLHTHMVRPYRTLWNPDITHLPVPMPALRDVVIDATTCEYAPVEEFCQYLTRSLTAHVLNTRVTVHIEGDPTRLSREIQAVCRLCKTVNVSIETVVFDRAQPSSCHSLSTVCNVDVSACLLPFSHLRHLVINTDTYNFQQLECFLTYAVSILGQHYLQHHVTASLYGPSEKIHPNLRNILTNVCLNVSEHEHCAPPNAEYPDV